MKVFLSALRAWFSRQHYRSMARLKFTSRSFRVFVAMFAVSSIWLGTNVNRYSSILSAKDVRPSKDSIAFYERKLGRIFPSKDYSHKPPTVYMGKWPAQHSAAMRKCTTDGVPSSFVRSRRDPSANVSILHYGYTFRDENSVLSLLTSKFAAYSGLVDDMSKADYFFIPLPLTEIVDCMWVRNEEERQQGVQAAQRSFVRTAKYHMDGALSDLINSDEYRLARDKPYPSIILPFTEYIREIQILKKASPFWGGLGRLLLHIGVEVPTSYDKNEYFLQVPYPSELQPHESFEKNVKRLVSSIKARKRLRTVYFAGECSRTRAFKSLCNGLLRHNKRDALVTAVRGMPLGSEENLPQSHYQYAATSKFCLHPRDKASTRRDMVTSALLGCIPVLVRSNSESLRLLLRPFVDFEQFWVVLDEADVFNMEGEHESESRVVKACRNVRVEDLAKVRQNLLDAIPRLMYSSWNDERDDAFGAILQNLEAVKRNSSVAYLRDQ